MAIIKGIFIFNLIIYIMIEVFIILIDSFWQGAINEVFSQIITHSLEYVIPKAKEIKQNPEICGAVVLGVVVVCSVAGLVGVQIVGGISFGAYIVNLFRGNDKGRNNGSASNSTPNINSNDDLISAGSTGSIGSSVGSGDSLESVVVDLTVSIPEREIPGFIGTTDALELTSLGIDILGILS